MTPSCMNQIRNTFLNENNPKANEFYIHKLLQDSSTNKNEVSAFQRCMRKTYNYDINSINAPIRDFYFVVLEIDATKNIESCSSTMNEHWYSLAFCLPKMEDCKENDFERRDILSKMGWIKDWEKKRVEIRVIEVNGE
jgi:hypothetical protein